MLSSSNLARNSLYSPRDQSCADKAVSPFALKKLEQAGLGDFVARVLEEKPFSREQSLRLAQISFPLLFALAQLQPEKVVRAKLRPLLFAAVQSELASNEISDVRDSLRLSLKNARTALGTDVPLSIAVDDWHSGNFARLLELLSALREDNVSILGPSTSELKLIAQHLEKKDTPQQAVAPSIFLELKSAGILSIEGGSDLKLHADAALHGFSLTFAHNLVRARLFQHTTGGAELHSSRSVESFLQDIFALRESLLPTGALHTWSLWSSWLLDSSLPKAEVPLGLEVLQALLLAKLLLPEVPWIRAPLSLVGMRLAEIAGDAGVSDFGYVAADTESARRLGLLPWSLVSGEFQAVHELCGTISSSSNAQVVYENG